MQVDPALAEKLVKQVEFYFSDTNLPTDNFMMKEVRKNKEGWVQISVIASFKKIRNLKAKSNKVVAEALRTSTELVRFMWPYGHRVPSRGLDCKKYNKASIEIEFIRKGTMCQRAD